MSKESVYQFLADRGFADHYVEFDESSTATVALAAQAIGCEEGRIAKTMSLSTREGAIVVVFNGVARLDNRKYKDTFHEKARFLQGEEVVEQTGHPIGGDPNGPAGGAASFSSSKRNRSELHVGQSRLSRH